MRHILSTSIASLVALCTIGKPTPAFGVDDPPKEDKPDVQLDLNDKVAGEEPPDFSFLDAKDPPASQDDQGGASEAKPAAEPQTEPPKGTPPKLPPVTDPNEDLPIPPVKPAQETKEQPVPDPKEQADKAAAEKKTADDAAATAAATKKAEDDKAAADAAAKAAAEVKLPTEEELDAMQPKPGAPAKVIEDFKKLKNEVVKPALNEVKRLKAEVETLRQAPQLNDEIKEKLRIAEEDRAWREAFELERDPKLSKEFEEKAVKAEDNLFKLLTEHPKLKLSKAAADQFKAMGINTPEGQATTQKIIDAVKAMNNELLLDEVKDAFKARLNIDRERQAKVEELRAKQGGLMTVRAEQEKEERMSWAKEFDKNLIDYVKDKQDFLIQDIPDKATEQEKQSIHAKNQEVKEKLVPLMHEGIRAMWQRDPVKGTKYVVDSINLGFVQEKYQQAVKELEAAKARIAELEGDSGRMRRITPSGVGEVVPTKAAEEAPVNMSAEDAIDAYRREKGLYPGAAQSR